MDIIKQKMLQEFSNEIRNNLEEFKLFPEEVFSDFLECIYVTTNLDSQGEKLPLEFLERFIQKVKTKQIYVLIEHDISQPPVGRVLDCKLAYDENEKEYFVYGLTGIFDQNAITTFAKLGIDRNKYLSFEKILEPDYESYLSLDSFSLSKDDYNELVDSLPSFIPKEVDDRLHKADDPHTYIGLFTSIFLLLANPFSKRILEIYGEETAHKLKEFYAYLKKHFFIKLLKKNYHTVIGTLESNYNGCELYFVVRTKDSKKIEKAVDTIYKAAESACQMVENIQYLIPTKLCYLFDDNSEDWLPEYIITKKNGVIFSKSRLIALEKYHGMSVSGSRGKIIF